MPRRRPKAVRDECWRPPRYAPVRRIPAVSARTRAAVRRAEDELNRPDMVAVALARFEDAFRQTGRYLNGPEGLDPGIEVEDARDDLEVVLGRLPSGARADLGRLVQRIDEEFE